MATLRTTSPLLLSLLAVVACSTVQPSRDGSAEDGSSPASERVVRAVAAPLPQLEGSAFEVAGRATLPAAEPESHPDLHNVFELSENIISGSEPEGEGAFQLLQEKGVRTILSVDGKEPEAELAAKYGMTYVHVPIRYNGITDEDLAKITKTFREKEGPFYVHCFHGKHRGPAAAEIGRLVLDGIDRETALGEMRQWCGTSESYEGLYRTVALADLPSESQTRAMDWDFPSASPLDGVAGAMVRITRSHDLLKALSKNDWRAPDHHPDANALNEAEQLAVLLQRTTELDETAAEPADFRAMMAASAEAAAQLRDDLRAMNAGELTHEQASASLKVVANSCTACHEVYRN
ncbi:cytochrome c [Engelhardtia mirabilis]|uniref:Cytochrome C n=1 Tax=Engelhardtia mirabilis TaxID=2528011 RepID=A0A518BQY4_9BACT|nr:hypothetical protein Pla133_45080 [Planctomycetes bacterium Pla133]QDV03715.1 hypothetical protein Pla86_45060 [Planctomycetes bacterium Pla86]